MKVFKNLFLQYFVLSSLNLAAQPGSLDTNFDIGSSFNNWRIIKLAVDAEERIYAVGGGSENSNPTFMARYLPDGTLDPGFNATFNNTIQTIAIQDDGKILLGGLFTTCNQTPRNRIVRLMPNGALDDSFVIGNGFNGSVWAISVQDDGKVVVGGAFTQYNNGSALRLVRLEENGGLDPSFQNVDFPNWIVEDIVLQPDGKIIAVGQFNGLGNANIPVGHVARFNSDGTYDQTFTASPGASGHIHCVVLQLDGKILLGGTFPTYNGQTNRRIIRLNTDGSIDDTFSTGEGFMSPPVNAIAVQPNGKIIAAGEFFTYNGTSSTRIIRLDANGCVDPFFSVGSGFDMTVYDLKLYSDDEQVLVGGQFGNYNGVARQRLALLNLGTGEEELSTDVVEACATFTWINGVTYTESTSGVTFSLLSTAGCDSTVALDLTIIPVNTTVVLAEGTLIAQAEGATFQWIDCLTNTAIAGATGNAFTPQESGEYAVEVTQNNCTASSECVNTLVTGVSDQGGIKTPGLKIYPNPASHQVTLVTGEPGKHVMLYDTRGILVAQWNNFKSPGSIDLSTIAAGTYIVEVRLANGGALRNRLILIR